MHRPNSQGMPNGLPPNWCGTQLPMQPQKNPSHQLNNGLESSQSSSRDSSPVARLSQLPPARGHIPASQLPPGRPGVISPIGQQHVGLNPNSVSATQVPSITPQSSPRVSNFTTSTPVLQTNDISAVPQKTESTINQFASPYNSAAIVQLQQMRNYQPQTGGNLPPTGGNLPSNLQAMRNFPPPISQTNVLGHDSSTPGLTQTAGNLPPMRNYPPSVGEQSNALEHASSTPTLHQTGGNMPQNSGNLMGIKQNLNQPQHIERPLSSGPSPQAPKLLSEQSQFSQSQGYLGALPTSSIANASATDNNQQRSAPTNQFSQQFNNLPPLAARQNMPSSSFDSNSQTFNNSHQPQASDNRPPISQSFNNLQPNSGGPKPNIGPPVITSGQPSPNGFDIVRSQMAQPFNNLPPPNSDRPPISQTFSALPPHAGVPTSNLVSTAMTVPTIGTRPLISQSFSTLPPNSGAPKNMVPPMISKSGQPSPAHSDSGRQSSNVPSGFDSSPMIPQSFNIPPFTGGPKPPMYPNTESNLPPYSGPRSNMTPPIINSNLNNIPSNLGAKPKMAPALEQLTNFDGPPISQNYNLTPKSNIAPPLMASSGPSPIGSRAQQISALPPTSGTNIPPPMAPNLSQPINPDMNRPPIPPYNLPQTAIASNRMTPPGQPSPANSDSSKTQTFNNFPTIDANRIPTQSFNNSIAPNMASQMLPNSVIRSNKAPQLMQSSGLSTNIISNPQQFHKLPVVKDQNVTAPILNYSNVRPSQQNPIPNLYNTTQLPAPIGGPPVAQIQPASVSSIHAKRYPQPQYQNQPPQTNYQPQPQQQQHQPNMNYQNPVVAQQTALPQPAINQQQYKQPTANYQQPQQNYNQRNYQQNASQQMSNMSIVNSGFNKSWGTENYDLLNCPNILPEEPVQPPKVHLGQEFLDNANCSSEIFRCTMTKIPESNSLLQKSRLPLGVLIHPFKDLNHLPVIQCTTIVRCRACRTYINPFIFFVDTKRWKCNLCYRVNELPEEFHYDPVSKSYGDPSRRPEIKSSTIEYIAPSEYMLRPPQPAVYLFLLDISRIAIESGYLQTVCEVLSTQLATLPGDGRTQIGFIAYNSTLHFFSLAEGLSQPHEMIVSEIDDVFLPCPDNLLVNLKEHMELITDLLNQLPTRYQNSYDGGSVLGAALQAAFKMMSSTGGRVSVFQTSLPMLGPGALTVREDPNQRAGKEAPHLNPATDFYKRLALDCSANQIAVDLFILNSQYVDVASLSGVSRFSGGCMYHFPLFKASRVAQAESLERCFRRYLSRKIGFEAVMRIRCTRGLAIHTFHGNFFVRSTDLLSLPNVNPDAGFGMQVSIEESLSDLQSVCFQAALLYTSSKGERRIRVHTLCLPIVSTLPEVLNAADQQCIVGFLAKMAVDRSLQTSLSDARDAFINAAIDILSSFKLSLNMGSTPGGLIAPYSLKLLPLYILALLKFTAFRTGQSTRLDDRVFAMCDMKTLPLAQLLQQIYPDLYPLHRLGEFENYVDSEGVIVPQLPRLQITSRNIDAHGVYLLDVGQQMIIFVCQNITPIFLTHTLGMPSFNSISDQCYELPKLDNPDNQRLHAFVNHLNDEKPYPASLLIMRENSVNRTLMLEHLIEDRLESALSYNEFLQHLKTQVK